ncbi:hypothetical protein HK103_007031 [Boothiomyces macroporosus]|uniref:Major facilitator superfamily (MFS) profile domain-containing protein n=1 Tax=Boothiomyces macroporosus TaxID=261099 RepID=A0AAD5UCP5_9FUNG|nr:hypothetical protein HK103_007031 [Boothiomyces macroporosus]
MISKVYLIAICTSLGGFTWGYDSGIIAGILNVDSFKEMVGINPHNQADLSGNIASSLLIGSIPAVFVLSYMNDNLGRKKTISISASVFLIGSIFQIFAWNLASVYIGRFVAGTGLAIMMVAIAMYNSEIAPTNIRGRLIGIQQIMVAGGIALSYWINYFVAALQVQGELAFRLPLAIQVIPCLALLLGLSFVPESPRWLMSKARNPEALEALKTIRDLDGNHPDLLTEAAEISKALDHHDKSQWIDVITKKNLHRLAVGIPLVVFQQFSGQNLINYFAPTMFENLGIQGRTADLFAAGFVGLVKMVMTLPGLWVIDTKGRRPLMLTGTAIMALAFLYIGIYSAYFQSTVLTIGGYFAILCIYIFMAAYTCSWGVMHYVIPSEIYPQELRAKSETVNSIFEMIFNILSVKIAPLLIRDMPNGGVYFLYGGLLSFFFCWIFLQLPETKGVPLEEIDILFSSWKRWKPAQREPEP